jgi:hypothetical protein
LTVQDCPDAELLHEKSSSLGSSANVPVPLQDPAPSPGRIKPQYPVIVDGRKKVSALVLCAVNERWKAKPSALVQPVPTTNVEKPPGVKPVNGLHLFFGGTWNPFPTRETDTPKMDAMLIHRSFACAVTTVARTSPSAAIGGRPLRGEGSVAHLVMKFLVDISFLL